jgi:hypothetical protein
LGGGTSKVILGLSDTVIPEYYHQLIITAYFRFQAFCGTIYLPFMLEKARTHLILISLGTLLCVFSFGSILLFIDPFKAGWLGHTFFYVAFFLMLIGITTLAGLLIRKRWVQRAYSVMITDSFRQAVIIAVLMTTLLILQAQHLLHWWTILTLILFLTVVEIFLNLDQ